jgi:hypothetical protein
MTDMAKRAKELGDALDECVTAFASGIPGGFLHERADQLIEQALLAERRLARIDAFEESAKIARLYQTAVAPTTNAAERIEYLILERAAAEKEVGK